MGLLPAAGVNPLFDLRQIARGERRSRRKVLPGFRANVGEDGFPTPFAPGNLFMPEHRTTRLPADSLRYRRCFHPLIRIPTQFP